MKGKADNILAETSFIATHKVAAAGLPKTVNEQHNHQTL